MHTYLALGTNLGDKDHNLWYAIQKIEEQIGSVRSVSSFFATAPWGFTSENDFLNAAICVETTLPPLEILERTQQIEREMGRSAKSVGGVYADRLIDIDLLLYDNLILTHPQLTLPHPLMTARLFVMEPLAEIAPDAVHPVSGKTMSQLLEQLKAASTSFRK